MVSRPLDPTIDRMNVADSADIAHLLRRTEFVVKPARLAELTRCTREQAVDNVLDFTPNANPQLPAYLTLPR